MSGLRLPFTPGPSVRTERLVLRAFREGDLDALHPLHSDPEAVRYVPFPPRDLATMTAALSRKMRATRLEQDGDVLEFAVCLHDGTLIGDLMLALQSVEHASLEVGYLFDLALAGRGYATEAVAAVLEMAFAGMGAHRVVARVDARNASSRALCARLGMRQESHLVENEWLKGEWSSETGYALLAREWAARPRWSVQSGQST